MKKINITFILLSILISSCLSPSEREEQKKLKQWKDDKSEIVKPMPFYSNTYEQRLDTFTYQNHLWLFYADYERGSVTHHPDCKNPKCQK